MIGNDAGELLPVIQADRDVYALIAPDMCALIYGGDLDKFPVMQEIARHRLRTTPASAGVLVEALEWLKSVRLFVTSREKIHPCGVDMHDELIAKLTKLVENGNG